MGRLASHYRQPPYSHFTQFHPPDMPRFPLIAVIVVSLSAVSYSYDLPTLPAIPSIPATQAPGSVTMGDAASFPEVKMDFPIKTGTFEPTWSSISSNLPMDSAMLRQKKFGIWVHYGPQAAGQSGDWYAQHMYQQGSTAYNNHLTGFGHPTVEGYKEFLNAWNPNALDPAALTQLYYNSGARFLLVQGVHHDNFDNWNSRYNPWNAVNLGPKRDTMAEWRDACRSRGMGFGVTFHHEYSWWFFQTAFMSDTSGAKAGLPYDAATSTNGAGTWWANYDPRFLYNVNLREYAGFVTTTQGYWNPSQGILTNHLDYAHWYANWWALRMLDVIENYDPDFVYTDGTSTQPFSGYGTGSGYKCDAMQRVIAHLENRSIERRGSPETFAMVKFHGGDRLTTTFEDNYPVGIKRDQPWIGEVPVGDWFYSPGFTYDSGMVIRYLLECVSRDGAAAICVSLLPNGGLDSGSQAMLSGIGQWMNINSAGIYGSRAWSQYGEGSRTLPFGKLGSTQANYAFTTSDFRYTVGADGFLYAYCMTVPSAGQTLTLTALGTGDGTLAAPITSVEMLGSSSPVTWTQSTTDLKITCPASMPFQTAVAFKIGPVAIIKPTQPLHLSAHSSSSSIQLSWYTPDPSVTFTVKRALAPAGPYTTIASGLSQPAYADTSVSQDQPYYYVVSASSGTSSSVDSDYTLGLLSSSSSWQSLDIGATGASGDHEESASDHVVTGSGGDVWYDNDQFHYVTKTLTGNGSITARVESIQNTGAWAKAGLMIRETTNTNSKYAFAFLSPSNGVAFQQRSTTGGNASSISNITGITAPVWLRLTRAGTTINAYRSTDGVSWTQFGTTTISMDSEVQVGLAVCSVSSGILNHALFSNVMIGAVSPTQGVSWQAPVTITADNVISLDGTLVHAGNFRSSGNVTVTVGGASINFVNRPASDAFTDLASGEEARIVSGAGGRQANTALFNASGTTVSTAFESVLDGSAWENTDAGPAPGDSDMVLQVRGAGGTPLTAGAIYQIQLFYSDDRSTSSTRGQRYHDGLGHATSSFFASESRSVIGTFIADSSGYMDFYAQNTTGGSNYPVGISSYVLRAIGPSDSDNDGLLDSWEISNFGNLQQKATDDPDGDGSDNLTEYRLGLDPRDSTKSFSAHISKTGLLDWPSAEGILFTVQKSSDLIHWTDDRLVSGVAGTSSVLVSTPSTGSMFYRVRFDPR
jgi:alpha-L-fucosidase